MANIDRYTAPLFDLEQPHVFDHFTESVVTGDRWTTLAADSGASVTTPDVVNGVARLISGVTNENEAAVRSTIALFKYGTNRALCGQARLQYAEAATNTANVFFGFASAFGADLLVDAGAGPRVTGDVCGIFKVDGGTVWRCVSQCNGVATVTASSKTAGGTTAQVLRVSVIDDDGVSMRVTFQVDGEILRDANGNLIRHRVAIASAAAMHVGVYAKTGSGVSETIDADYVYGAMSQI